MNSDEFAPYTPEELAAEGVSALPDKEVVSILDLAADVDLAIDGAAPIDLAVALNANVVAPIDAAVSANLLSDGSTAQALSDQGVAVTQTIEADALATGIQDSTIDQSDTVDGGSIIGTLNETTGVVVDSAGALVGTVTGLVDGATVAGSDGQVLGVLDAATGNVLDGSGNVVGVLDPLTGEVLNTVGSVVGTVTGLVDGTTVLDSAGNVVGILDGATGNVVNAAGNVVGALDPL